MEFILVSIFGHIIFKDARFYGNLIFKRLAQEIDPKLTTNIAYILGG